MKRMLAGVSAAAMMLSQSGVALAAYSDVPSGVWYEDAVEAFLDADYLDASQTRFRGGDFANRAEFVKLVVELNGGILSTPPAVPSFDDVAPGTWYYGYFEEAGKEGWVRGDGSCYGTKPCFARPAANINRAEAGAIIVRAFALDPTGDAPQFVDNPSGQWYTDVLQTAADHCVLQGDDSTGRVRPSDNMNRAEMVVMLNRVDQGLMYGEDCGDLGVGEPAVSDVVATSPTTVEVEFNVSLDQTAAMDETHYEVAGDTDLTVVTAEIVSDDTVELTLGTATVAGEEYTLTVTDLMTADGTAFSDSVIFSGYTSIVPGDGTLEVSLSSNTPVGDTVPQGAIGVVMTSVDLTASDDDVILENVTVLHEGFGDETNISGIYGVINGERVTRKRTIDSQSTTATIRFQTPLIVRAGETVTLDVAADFTTGLTASSEHSLTVELPSDLEGNPKEVTGNFPLRGNTFRIAAVTTGIVTVAYRSVTPTTVEVGDTKVTLGKFELSLNSTEDQTIYSMTLENDGTTGDGDVTNLQIRRSDGTVLTNTVSQTVADFATFVFDPPFTILEGDRVTFEIVGDVVDGAAKTVKIHFDEASDIFAVGSLYGYGVNGQLYGSQIQIPDTSTLPSTVTIDAGQFTISIDGPPPTDFTPDDDDAVLANILFQTGGEDVDVEELYIAIQGTTSTGAAFVTGRNTPTAADELDEILEDIEIRNTVTGRTVNGVQVAESTRATTGNGTGAYAIYRFDDFVVSGDESYQFRVDFIDNSGDGANAAPASGDRFKVHICGEATHELDSTNALITNTTGCAFGGIITASTTYQMKITGASTNDRIGDVRPGGVISGSFHDIETSSLTIVHRAAVSSDTAVRNAKDVNIMRFEAQASEAQDVLLTDMIFESANEFSLINATNYTLWVDSNSDGNVDTILQTGVAAQSNSVTFNDLANGGWVIPANGTSVFEVHGDIASSLSGSNPILKLRFDTGATFVQAEEVDDGSSLAGIRFSQSDGTLTVVDSSICTVAAGDCQIRVTTANSTAFSLRNSGDLYVTKSSTPVRERQLLGGTTESEILRLQFHAEYEDIEVQELVFTSSGSNASDLVTNVDNFQLFKAGQTTAFASARQSDCATVIGSTAATKMCASLGTNQLVVPKGEDLDILVRPVMKTDNQGGDNGDIVSIYIDKTPTTKNGTGAVIARGRESSNELAPADSDSTAEGEVFIGRNTAGSNAHITGPGNHVVMSKVTSIVNADPNANGTPVPTGNDRAIGQFTFTAANHDNGLNGLNDWTLSGIIFDVNATNVSLGSGDQTSESTSDFFIYNKSNPSVKQECTANVAVASGSSLKITCKDFTNTADSSIQTAIDPGTSATFVLETDIANSKLVANNNSVLQVSLTNFTTRVGPTDLGTTAVTQSHVSWVDEDGGTDAEFHWIEYPETSVNSTSYGPN